MADNKLKALRVVRQWFHVELKPDEMTFVSWKKLVKDLAKVIQNLPFEPLAGAHPALQDGLLQRVMSKFEGRGFVHFLV
ncbi:hypothetical protein SUGI_0434950 [Cryptomeria japonica]|nr:hypothetical protein SUGI_0434950 [Cryptomeria japonica]